MDLGFFDIYTSSNLAVPICVLACTSVLLREVWAVSGLHLKQPRTINSLMSWSRHEICLCAIVCAGLFSCFGVQTSEKWIGWSCPIVSGTVIFVGLEWVISHELLSRLHWFYLAWGWKPCDAEIEPKRPTFFWIVVWSWKVWNLDSTYYILSFYWRNSTFDLGSRTCAMAFLPTGPVYVVGEEAVSGLESFNEPSYTDAVVDFEDGKETQSFECCMEHSKSMPCHPVTPTWIDRRKGCAM